MTERKGRAHEKVRNRERKGEVGRGIDRESKKEGGGVREIVIWVLF